MLPPVSAKLRAQQQLRTIAGFDRRKGRKTRIYVTDRKHAERGEQPRVVQPGERTSRSKGQSVEIEILVVEQIGVEKRIGHPAEGDRIVLQRRERNEGLVEPKILLVEPAAQKLCRRNRTVIIAGAKPYPDLHTVGHIRGEPEAGSQAEQVIPVARRVQEGNGIQDVVWIDIGRPVGIESGIIDITVETIAADIVLSVQIELVAAAEIAVPGNP